LWEAVEPEPDDPVEEEPLLPVPVAPPVPVDVAPPPLMRLEQKLTPLVGRLPQADSMFKKMAECALKKLSPADSYEAKSAERDAGGAEHGLAVER